MAWSRIRSRGRLPHWEEYAGIYFVTFRLADSLPKDVIAGIRVNLQGQDTMNGRRSKQVEEYLDRGAGKCSLGAPEIAEIVAGALTRFEGVRYRLFAWCIMPNHVHAVIQPFQPSGLSPILHSWKSYSAQIINRKLKRKGAFWQREYYDHLIRNGGELGRAIAYTAENPEKAGLRGWKWVYVAKDWS